VARLNQPVDQLLSPPRLSILRRPHNDIFLVFFWWWWLFFDLEATEIHPKKKPTPSVRRGGPCHPQPAKYPHRDQPHLSGPSCMPWLSRIRIGIAASGSLAEGASGFPVRCPDSRRLALTIHGMSSPYNRAQFSIPLPRPNSAPTNIYSHQLDNFYSTRQQISEYRALPRPLTRLLWWWLAMPIASSWGGGSPIQQK